MSRHICSVGGARGEATSLTAQLGSKPGEQKAVDLVSPQHRFETSRK